MFLLSCGASPIDNDGDTIMHYVCTTDRIDFISTLAEDYSELLDHRGYQNKTPLMWAISRQSEDAVVFLLARGVDVKAIDNNGKSVLDYARESENQRIIDSITNAIDLDLYAN